MESISALEAEKKLTASGLKFVTSQEVKKLLGIDNANTIHKMLLRWVKYDILMRLKKGLYLLTRVKVEDFEIANKLVEPSYVSLETALNFYGILPQFPYVITSITTRKTNLTRAIGKDFEYVRFTKELFWGYEKQGEFVIATPEKAIVDQLYLASKGLRSVHVEEWDLSKIDRIKLKDYASKIKYIPFVKLFKAIKL